MAEDGPSAGAVDVIVAAAAVVIVISPPVFVVVVVWGSSGLDASGRADINAFNAVNDATSTSTSTCGTPPPPLDSNSRRRACTSAFRDSRAPLDESYPPSLMVAAEEEEGGGGAAVDPFLPDEGTTDDDLAMVERRSTSKLESMKCSVRRFGGREAKGGGGRSRRGFPRVRPPSSHRYPPSRRPREPLR